MTLADDNEATQLVLSGKEQAVKVPNNTIASYHTRVYMNGRDLGLKQADAAYIAEISALWELACSSPTSSVFPFLSL